MKRVAPNVEGSDWLAKFVVNHPGGLCEAQGADESAVVSSVGLDHPSELIRTADVNHVPLGTKIGS